MAEIFHLSFFFHMLIIFFQLYSPLGDNQSIFANHLWLCNDDHLEKKRNWQTGFWLPYQVMVIQAFYPIETNVEMRNKLCYHCW